MSNFRFGYCYAGKVSDAAVIARAVHTALAGNVDYISSAILVAYGNGCSHVSVDIWPDELGEDLPEFLTDYRSFITFCNKALQEDKYD